MFLPLYPFRLLPISPFRLLLIRFPSSPFLPFFIHPLPRLTSFPFPHVFLRINPLLPSDSGHTLGQLRALR